MKVLFWIQKILWVLLLILVLNPTEIILGQNLSSDEEYLSIIEKIKKGEDTETDYTKLRMLYTQTSFYQPESAERDENILKMTQAWIDKHDNEAIEIGNQLLEGEYLNPFVHDLFAKIYKESGEGDPLFHLLMFINIITSIQGDGKSYETAYQVISTWEEKAMMTFVRVSPVDQVFEPTLHDGHCYHVIQVKADETGEISDLYFNIDIPYQKAQQTGPVVTAPVITPPTPTPALQPITTYTDPTGQFSIHFPAGFSLLASQTNLIQCLTPNNGNLYLIISDYANTMKAFSDEVLNRPASFSGESQFQAGNLSGKIQLYTMSGSFQVLDGKSYAVLLVTYAGIDYGLVVVLPAESYSAAQNWLSALVTGVQYQPATSPPPVVLTPTVTPTFQVTNSLEYTVLDGLFQVLLPAGSSQGGKWPNIAEYQTPSQGTLYILSGDTAGTLNLFRQDLTQKQGKMLSQPVLFQTDEGVQGRMEINTMVGNFQAADGKDYISFLVSYERPEGALVIIVPNNLYTEAQGWISPLITDVTFQAIQPTPSPFLTPMPTATTMVTPPPSPSVSTTTLPSETLPPLSGL
ncbi:DUF4919 domain-containing protein [Atribacter laminatus]|uniref:DUF4919 domain-containing protein n=1 Tax=Atribacter laminatus TaxID=2847778 RepID=A0A7T1F3L2_ATRLM|nr:DUF4919 domain-containing protein [Atribacter laminatus]QPM68476.1 hypothetical protein RT761_01697 [Atribacter laminatus]